MTEYVDTSPDVDVQAAEYTRLLGYPRGRKLGGRAGELAASARAWYAENGHPWVYARQAASLEIGHGSVRIEGVPFISRRLQSTLEEAQAESLFLVAVSAGEELEQRARQLWQQGKPDEYYFLEVYGSAVVEHLTTMHGARLCAWADSQHLAVLPHFSPGYTDWDISQQSTLLKLLRESRSDSLPGSLEVLSSGMLRPKKSLLAVFGLTRQLQRVRRLTELNPCESCSFLPCQYRRVPYRRAPAYAAMELGALDKQALFPIGPAPVPLDRGAKYTVNAKALARWAVDRLTLTRQQDGTTNAVFQYEGTTCSNLGSQLLFDYHVTLGLPEQGYPIQSQRCGPTADDEGYKSMCRYLDDAQHLMAALDQEKPLLGQPLNNVLFWNSPASAAGCHCELSDRMHKWRLVLETIHYALVQQEMLPTQTESLPAEVP